MKLYSLLFADSPPVYYRYAKALQASVEANAPHSNFQVLEILDEDKDIYAIGRGRSTNYVQNTRKTRHQHRVVSEAEDGELIGFLDADMMVLKPLHEIQEYTEFDFAYTMKPPSSGLRLNTGVTFTRVSDRVRQFYRNWEEAALILLRDKKQHQRFIKEYGGINQSSLGALLQRDDHGLRVFQLCSAVWNCTQDTAASARERAKVVHLLRNIRQVSLMNRTKSDDPHVQWLVEQWRKYDRV